MNHGEQSLHLARMHVNIHEAKNIHTDIDLCDDCRELCGSWSLWVHPHRKSGGISELLLPQSDGCETCRQMAHGRSTRHLASTWPSPACAELGKGAGDKWLPATNMLFKESPAVTSFFNFRAFETLSAAEIYQEKQHCNRNWLRFFVCETNQHGPLTIE